MTAREVIPALLRAGFIEIMASGVGTASFAGLPAASG